MDLVPEAIAGSQRALARLATHIENDDAVGRAALECLFSQTGQAHIVGITGPPGAGKSTLINGLIGVFRRSGRRVGVIAVDPTSPISGGAALGDRIRMFERSTDEGVFIRSMASRGHAGGLAPAAVGLIHLLDAAGYGIVIVETVGVGQQQVDVAGHVHTLALVQVPRAGDAVQLMKAGLLEFADLFVVNKADHSGAEELTRELRVVAHSPASQCAGWTPPVVRCVATTGEGVDEVATAIDAHWDYLRHSNQLEARWREMVRAEVRALLDAELRRRLGSPTATSDLIEKVAGRRLAPLTAAVLLLDRWHQQEE